MKYHIIVFGCQMNISDSERIAAVFDSLRFSKTDNIEEANIVAVAMCSVRQSAVDRAHWVAEKIKKLKIKNPHFKAILTGCVLKKDAKKFTQNFDFVIDIKDLTKLPELLARQQILKDSRRRAGTVSRLGGTDTPSIKASEALAERSVSEKILLPNGYLDIAPKYSNKTVAHVPIMTGCNNFCSYCVVPYTRGREISRPAEEIVCEVKNLIKNGCKEIWLLGQNVNSYEATPCDDDRRHKVIMFPELLKMIDGISGSFEFNFTSSHPKDFSDELIKTMVKCKHLSKRLNLPIQSGDDKILKKMNRPYTVAGYKNLVKKIKKSIPDISLSTDIIVGFPGETKKQFGNTVKTFKEIGFDMAFINKYSPREGTAAAKLKDNVPWQEKKRREKILIDLVNAK